MGRRIGLHHPPAGKRKTLVSRPRHQRWILRRVFEQPRAIDRRDPWVLLWVSEFIEEKSCSWINRLYSDMDPSLSAKIIGTDP
jgi:hypothetical protein